MTMGAVDGARERGRESSFVFSGMLLMVVVGTAYTAMTVQWMADSANVRFS
jgi:hypothetical protein